MLKNHLVVAARTFRKHLGFGLMNVIGLAVGMAACFLVLLFVQDELSYDRMFGDADRIYRIVEARTQADGIEQHTVHTAGLMGSAAETSIPEVEQAVSVLGAWVLGRRTVKHGERQFYEGRHLVTEPAFFDFFDFEFVHGSSEGALDEPFEVILTEESAERYFGSEDPLAKILLVEGLGDVTVRGVVRLPPNTHLDFSMLISYASILQYEGFIEWLETWGSTASLTFVKLRQGVELSVAQRKLQDLAAANFDDDAARRVPYLQALPDIHFESGHIQFDQNHNPGRRAYVIIFSLVALLVLLIACVNYMNMATARALSRAREVGVRKVVGASRAQVTAQFLAESLLSSTCALGLAWLLVWALLPTFNDVSGKEVALSALASGSFPFWAIAITLGVSLLSGSYPAVFLSQFRPVRMLTGSAAAGRRASVIRRGLVVGQFVMAIFLIGATLVVEKQLHYLQSKPLGFDEEQLIIVDINSGAVRRDFETVKQEMQSIAGVLNVSVSNRIPGDWKGIPEVDLRLAGAPESELVIARFLGVDEDFLDTYRIEVAGGVGFSGHPAIDSTSVLVNETAAQLLNASVGDRLYLPESDFQASIIGIVGDFHFHSLHASIGPMVLGFRNNPVDAIDYFTIRHKGGDAHATVDALRAIGERVDPDHPFEYNFLDARLAEYYMREQQVRQVFGAAAAVAISLACLGLFGLAAFVAERRTKEIGVRKAMGATTARIVRMLTSEFSRLIAVSFLIAAPVSYLAMDSWLREFPYRVSVGGGTMVLAGSIALGLAVLTVGYQALKAAMANPAECLQYE